VLERARVTGRADERRGEKGKRGRGRYEERWVGSGVDAEGGYWDEEKGHTKLGPTKEETPSEDFWPILFSARQ
jgi:hypothetical protein